MIDPRTIFGRLGNQMFQYAFLYANSKDKEIDFYYQDPNWWAGYEDEIKFLFGSNIPLPTDKVAIHIRRGFNPLNPNEPKYLDNPFYVDLARTDYYKKAISMFPNDEFIIFTDDPDWVIKYWREYECERMEMSVGKNEIDDMNLMASCKGHIIANSSFSFWGAYISPYTEKVVAPRNWYADGEQRTKCPKDWILI